MLGWIIPDPLHIPPTRTVTPPTSTSTWAVLGRVSVVMIARAADSPPSGLSVSHACAIPGLIASIGRKRPITPVELTSTWSGSRSSLSADSFAISSASRNPCAPVQAFALPELIVSAWTRLRCKCNWSITTEADFTLFVVKTPPVSHGCAEWTTHRSSRWLVGMADAPVVNALMPHAAVPARNPRANVTAIASHPRARSCAGSQTRC